MQVLHNYGRDLETVRKLYQKQKNEPIIPRNLPPISGKISWARQLYRKIEKPMKEFKRRDPDMDLLKTEDAKKIIRNYNKMAAVLMEFEVSGKYLSLIRWQHLYSICTLHSKQFHFLNDIVLLPE